MAKKDKENEVKKKKKSGATGGQIIGTLLRSVVVVLGFILKIIIKVCKVFGLWLPLVYALFGLILYLAVGFNPFNFDTLGTLYLCGGIACIIGAAIISVRNFIVRPAKNIYEGFKHPLWEKKKDSSEDKEELKEQSKWEKMKKQKEEERFSPPEIERFEAPKNSTVDYGDLLAPLADFDSLSEESESGYRRDWLPKKIKKDTEKPQIVAAPPTEKPQVYFSALEPDVLVHEYSDRFELYKVSGHRTIPIGVEYKQ